MHVHNSGDAIALLASPHSTPMFIILFEQCFANRHVSQHYASLVFTLNQPFYMTIPDAVNLFLSVCLRSKQKTVCCMSIDRIFYCSGYKRARVSDIRKNLQGMWIKSNHRDTVRYVI